MDDKARAKKLKAQDTDRASFIRAISKQIAESAEQHLEMNGSLEGFDLHMKICEFMDSKEWSFGEKWDRNDWDWSRMENDVKRVTSLYLS